MISENAETRKYIREITRREGILISKARDPEEKSEFELYYDFKEPIQRLVPHRILAVNRGEKESHLKVHIEAPVDRILEKMTRQFIKPQE